MVAVTCVSSVGFGTALVGLVIALLLAPFRFDYPSRPQTSLRCSACAARQARPVAAGPHGRTAECCGQATVAHELASAPAPRQSVRDSRSLPNSAVRIPPCCN